MLFNEAENEYEIIKNLEIINQGEYRGDVLNYYRNDIHGLFGAVDEFIGLTEKEHIPYYRLMELVTLFKDGPISDDKESAFEFFENCCEMTDKEKEWFDIEEDSPIANTKFENPMYNKGYDDGFSDGANNADIES